MPDQVKLLYEDQGRPVPLHRQAFGTTAYTGEFVLEEEHVLELKRTLPVARLMRADSQGDALPRLYDAKTLWVKRGEARVTGFEIDPVSHRRTIQTWVVRFDGWKPSRDYPAW